MSNDNYMQHVDAIKDRLNAVSPSFCAMKWLHQTAETDVGGKTTSRMLLLLEY